MKKTLFILSLLVASLGVISCEKKEKADVLTEETMELEGHPKGQDVNTEVPAVSSQEDLIKKAQSHPLTSLALSENHFDFKQVKKGASVEHIYEVTNTGNNPLIISEVKPACGCTAPNYTKTPILPGQKGQITLKFDSSSFDGMQNKQAEIFANVEKAPVVISFSANVIN